MKNIIRPLLILGILGWWFSTRLAAVSEFSDQPLAEAAGQFLLPAMLVVAGCITYCVRRCGASQMKAFGLPLLIQLLLTGGFFIANRVHRDVVHMFPIWIVFAVTLVPMVVVCGITALIIKPADDKAGNSKDTNTR
ncbi:MAG: hypothetical protein NTZ16_14195 [Verrucomicrobia bacterium]|nr:hypothetical protein [Verrucomicrobiota bacterium]